MELDSNVYSVVVTAITVLGGTSAWRFYERRQSRKEKDQDFFKHDYKDRISKLESLLTQSSEEKDEMRSMILKLTSQVASLKVQVEFLTKEERK
mgnify:FL=1|tara:strand:- start:12 stop:293 length:282 start_codon:yes stop_codon:yes gene_type:complete